MFERAPDANRRRHHHVSTARDAEGIVATIPVVPRHTTYLFDAVVLQRHTADGPEDAVWQTLWAALDVSGAQIDQTALHLSPQRSKTTL